MSDAHQLIELSRKEDLPVFSAGDTVNVTFKITEGDRERQQAFRGTVIKKDLVVLQLLLLLEKLVMEWELKKRFPYILHYLLVLKC